MLKEGLSYLFDNYSSCIINPTDWVYDKLIEKIILRVSTITSNQKQWKTTKVQHLLSRARDGTFLAEIEFREVECGVVR